MILQGVEFGVLDFKFFAICYFCGGILICGIWENKTMAKLSIFTVFKVTKDNRDPVGGGGGGGCQYKRPHGDMLPTRVAKSASWYMNDPL